MRLTIRSVVAMFLCGIALGSACNAADVTRETGTREEAARALASADPAARRAGAARLGEVGRMSDVTALVKALSDRDGQTRSIAESSIWEVWGRSGDPEIDKLYAQGVAFMNFGAAREAIQVFSLVIEKKPDFAEGWNKRATVYYSIGECKKSLQDCDEVIKRNPLHFGALAGYGLIYTQLDQPERALDYFRRALKINPNMHGVEQNIEMLEQHNKTKRRSYI